MRLNKEWVAVAIGATLAGVLFCSGCNTGDVSNEYITNISDPQHSNVNIIIDSTSTGFTSVYETEETAIGGSL